MGCTVALLSYLLSAQKISRASLIQSSFAVVLLVVGNAAVAFPIARVAETFEYDVLRALNRPEVVRSAQRHFGQQFLSHLKTLEWGFRAGGTVISMRIIAQFFMGLIITVSTAM